jgi:hypothetical protein
MKTTSGETIADNSGAYSGHSFPSVHAEVATSLSSLPRPTDAGVEKWRKKEKKKKKKGKKKKIKKKKTKNKKKKRGAKRGRARGRRGK